ncbi:MAG: DUF5777 family beta-barrel protein [bacterium]|nr:DUF5777 family beta-barrel protein [bacterium]
MKNNIKQQLTHRFPPLALLVLFLALGNLLNAQDSTATEGKKEYAKKTFIGNLIIDNQTCMVPVKGVFEFVIQHRFGTMENGYEDFAGLYASSNIRLGFNYTPIENLQVGFGFTKEQMMWDANIKYALVKQGKSGGSPVSVTYFGLMGIDTRPKEGNFVEDVDRLSYFHQLILARKVTKDLSIQVAPSFSWYNNVEGYVSTDGSIKPTMNNGHLAIAFMGCYALSDKFSIIVNYDQPLTEHTTNNPDPNISFGFQVGTSSHTFQLFVGNYHSIVPQMNNFYNHNNYKDGASAFLIGFNITKR